MIFMFVDKLSWTRDTRLMGNTKGIVVDMSCHKKAFEGGMEFQAGAAYFKSWRSEKDWFGK